MLKAKNSRLGCQMSQSDFNASVQESLAGWEAARSSTTGIVPQPSNEAPATPSCTPAADPLNESEGSAPLSKAVIQPGRSIKVLLSSGKYAAPDLVHHVRNLQYAPLPMFSVKEMH
ncbi:hypothetical protein BS47DRAFT_1348259, partial [Hydnum rufescens UP504]